MKCVERTQILRHLAGKLSEKDQAVLERHLAECEVCARAQDELIALSRRLLPDPGEFDDPRLADDVMTLIRLGRATPERTVFPRARSAAWWLVPAAAVVAVALVLIGPWSQDSDTVGFQVRSGSARESDRMVSFEVFKSAPEGYHLVADRIDSADALAFAYTNRSAGLYRYLMVLAVDAGGRVFWFYPSHLRQSENPASVGIVSGSDRKELPEEIRHAFRTGSLRIFALFSAQPLHVRTVESVVAGELSQAGSIESLQRLGLDNTGQQTYLLSVVDASEERGQP